MMWSTKHAGNVRSSSDLDVRGIAATPASSTVLYSTVRVGVVASEYFYSPKIMQFVCYYAAEQCDRSYPLSTVDCGSSTPRCVRGYCDNETDTLAASSDSRCPAAAAGCCYLMTVCGCARKGPFIATQLNSTSS